MTLSTATEVEEESGLEGKKEEVVVYGRQPAITGYATVAQTAFSLVATDNSNDKLLGVSLPVHIAYASTNKTTENCLIRDRTFKD